MKTLYDIVAHIIDVEDVATDTVTLRRAVRAAVWAVEQAQTKHQWSNFHDDDVHLLPAPVDVSATVDAGGVLTLSTGTLPVWAGLASAKFGKDLRRVERRISNTSLLLAGWNLPAKTTAQSVTLFGNRISLESEVREIYRVHNLADDLPLTHLEPQSFRAYEENQNAVPGTPVVVTSRRVTNITNTTTELIVSPPPSSDTTISISHYRSPMRANLLHFCGDVTIDNKVATIENRLPVTAVARNSIMLLSGTSEDPAADIGFGFNPDNPPVAMLNVDAITGSTTVLLVSGDDVEAPVSGIIADVIDLPEFVYPATLFYAEAAFKRYAKGNMKEYADALMFADMQLRLAMEQESTLAADIPFGMSRRSNYYPPENTVVVP